MAKSASGKAGRKKKASSSRAKAAKPNAQSKSLNAGLSAAKAAKKDEFYTQYIDIQKEVEAYLEYDPDTFRGKVVYCNCDDPFESNFFKYFAANFNKLGLKKLITTSYDGSPIAGRGTLFEEYNAGNGKREIEGPTAPGSPGSIPAPGTPVSIPGSAGGLRIGDETRPVVNEAKRLAA